MAIANRITPELKNAIIDDGAERLKMALDTKIVFKDIHNLWSMQDEGRMYASTSFSHPNPNQPSREQLSAEIAMNMFGRLGLAMNDYLVVAHDLGLPHKDNPKGYVIELEGFSDNQKRGLLKVLSSDVVYALQDGSRLRISDIDMVEQVLRREFRGGGHYADERIENIKDMLLCLERGGEKGTQRAVPKLLALRDAQLSLIGIEHRMESSAANMMDIYADALETFATGHGKYFYHMPVTPRFEPQESEFIALQQALPDYYPSPYLRGIFHGSNEQGKSRYGVRMPVVFDGKTFAFFISDPRSPRTENNYNTKFKIDRNGIAYIEKREIFEAMRDRLVLPTVPTMMLVDCIGSQVPQIGAQDWKVYAEDQVRMTARWLGMDPRQAKNLTISTHGLEALGVRTPKGVRHGFFVNYLTFGRENMLRALQEGNYYEAPYGTVVEPGGLSKFLAEK